MLTLSRFPRAILHIDGDAFFASCEQANNPKLKGKPVITGSERGIVASLSYEAKALGVQRCMRLTEVKKLFPQVILLPSDYETYSLLSQRFFNIVRRYTPDVEEYSIDECFADLTGLRRLHKTSYENIAKKIQADLEKELGFTFSLGLAPNKVLAKVGSKWKKPNGFTAIPGKEIHLFLQDLSIEKIWGIGHQTTAYLNKFNIKTALEFALKSEEWVKTHVYKPHYEIWQELNGKFILPLNPELKTSYQSISKTKTFTPPSRSQAFVLSQLAKNIENACIKARRYNLETNKVIIFLRTQDFEDLGLEVKLSRFTAFPNEIIDAITDAFNHLFDNNKQYRQTGIVLANLQEKKEIQPDLFNSHLKAEQYTRLYQGIDSLKQHYGKHSVHLGVSFFANNTQQHTNERGTIPSRKHNLFKGETKRKRIAIPMLFGSNN